MLATVKLPGSFLVQEETQREHVSMSSCTCNACAVQAYNGSRPTTRVTELRRETPAVGLALTLTLTLT